MVSIELTKLGQRSNERDFEPLEDANQRNMVEFEIRKVGLVIGHMFNYSQLGFHKGRSNFQRSPNDNFGFFSYLHHYNCSGFFMPIEKNDVMF
jgi:hypothetical protein